MKHLSAGMQPNHNDLPEFSNQDGQTPRLPEIGPGSNPAHRKNPPTVKLSRSNSTRETIRINCGEVRKRAEAVKDARVRFGDELILLLSNLESMRVQLERLPNRQSGAALQVCRDMVAEVRHAERHLDAESAVLLHTEAAALIEAIEQLQGRLALSWFQRLLSCFGGSAGQTAKQRKKAKELQMQVVDVLRRCFALLSDRMDGAADWQQATDMFLAQLNKLVAEKGHDKQPAK